MEREFKGVWIPKRVWLDKRLTLAEKCILTEIAYFDDGEEGCKINNDYLANFAQLSVRSVATAIAKLSDLGYIIIENSGNKGRTIHINENLTVQKTTTNRANIAELTDQPCKICTQRNKVSKKVNKKNIFNLSAGAHTHEEQKFEIESYNEILDNLDVHGVYRMAVFNFIKHLQANGCKVINSRLESLVIALDRRYRTNDIGKCVEIKTAITNGYKRLPCEEYWGLN